MFQRTEILRRERAAVEEPALDDTGWTAVNLPHDWSIGQPFDPTLPHGSQHAYLPNGVVNYRKRFRADAEAASGFCSISTESTAPPTSL